jgi:hypothetical protein
MEGVSASPRFYADDPVVGSFIAMPKKRSAPISLLHESDEAKYWAALPKNNKYISKFYSGEKFNKLIDTVNTEKEAFNAGKNFMLDSKNIVGSHVSPSVLINEKNVMSKIPRYIDPFQFEVGELRRARDLSNEYSTIGMSPFASSVDRDGIGRHIYITQPGL